MKALWMLQPNRARTAILAAALLTFAAGAAAENLVAEGDFESVKNGVELRKDAKGLDWYESRKDTEEGRKLCTLSKKKIGGNATRKAMLKAHPDLNAYLSYRFPHPLEATASARYDIVPSMKQQQIVDAVQKAKEESK